MFAVLWSFVVFLLAAEPTLTFGGVYNLPVDSDLGLDKLLKGLEFLKRFSYIHLDAGKNANGLDIPAIKSGIGKFQTFLGLPKTESIDQATLDVMEQPRCGCKDPEFAREADRDKFRYGMEGGKWNKTELTIRITRIPPKLSKKHVRKALKQACRVWSSRSLLKFTEVRSQPADITIKFMGLMNHGDRRPFWHPESEVAHGFPPTDPQMPGEIHMDASENYTFAENAEGIDMFQILVHQIGHALGLGHSPDPLSVMFPIVRPRDPEYALTRNDMAGLHALYGRKNREKGRHAVHAIQG